jgi:hypothetical protein
MASTGPMNAHIKPLSALSQQLQIKRTHLQCGKNRLTENRNSGLGPLFCKDGTHQSKTILMNPILRLCVRVCLINTDPYLNVLILANIIVVLRARFIIIDNNSLANSTRHNESVKSVLK